MSDEVDASVIQKTQQTLGKYIQRPQLTDKLLRRPPFRFLHDIVTTAIKQYGILDHVFERQELISDNMKDKEAKIAFLQKLISRLSSQVGEELKAKPSKIVAGSEPQKTNEMLVALAKVLEDKHQNTTSKTKNKATTNSQAHSNGNSVSSPPKVPKPSMKTSTGATTVKKTADEAPKPTVPVATVPKADSKSKANANIKAKEVPNKTPAPTKPLPSKSSLKTPEDPVKKRVSANGNKSSPAKSITNQSSPKNSPKIPKEPPPKNSPKSPKEPPPKNSPKSPRELPPKNNPKSPKEQPRKKSANVTVNDVKTKEEPLKPPTDGLTVPLAQTDDQQIKSQPVVDSNDNLAASDNLGSPDSGILMENPKSATTSATAATGTQEGRHSSGRKSAVAERNSSPSKPVSLEVRHSKDTRTPIPVVPDAVNPLDSPRMGTAVFDSGGKLSPHLAVVRKETFERPPARAPPQRQQSMTARPKSSRRPPSRTGRERLTLVRPDSRAAGGPSVPHVILDGHSLPTDDEDEEDKIVQAAVLDQNFTDDLSDVSERPAGNQQSKLVEQILSAQREFVDSDDLPGKDTTASSQRLKSLIQEVAQAAQPLGHLIPLIHEDLEVMYNEWHAWKREGDRLHEQLERERSSVQSSMDELLVELARLDAAIDMQRAKLSAAKASLLRGQGDVALLITNFGKLR